MRPKTDNCVDCGCEKIVNRKGLVSPRCADCRQERQKMTMRNYQKEILGREKRPETDNCVDCGCEKPVSRSGRRNPRCVPCYKKHKIAGEKKWRLENPKKARETRENWEERNPGWQRRACLKRLYGVTVAEYNLMIERQEGLCAICEEPLGENRRAHAVDHDHSDKGSDSVRGVVHDKCNALLGHIEKNSSLLPKIAAYLRKHAAKKRDEAFRNQETANRIEDLSRKT